MSPVEKKEKIFFFKTKTGRRDVAYWCSVRYSVMFGWSRGARGRGPQSMLRLYEDRHGETYSTGVRQTIPDMGDRETQG